MPIDSFWIGTSMSGDDRSAEGFLTYLRLEERVPTNQPLRKNPTLVDAALTELSRTFRHGFDPAEASAAGRCCRALCGRNGS